jgi:hypothetical protein
MSDKKTDVSAKPTATTVQASPATARGLKGAACRRTS